MKKKTLRFFILLNFLILTGCAVKEKETIGDPVPEQPSKPAPPKASLLLEKKLKKSPIRIGETIFYPSQELIHFYKNRNYRLSWSDNGKLLTRANLLVQEIENSSDEGLEPEDYKINLIKKLLGEIHRLEQDEEQKLESIVNLDILLTNSFLLYSSHLIHGRVNPELIDDTWSINYRETNPVEVLENVIESNQLIEAIEELKPEAPEYKRLRDALIQYKDIAARGGWPRITEGPVLKEGSRDNRVITLRKRLILSGDLKEYTPPDPQVFDKPLEHAVRRFQKRHGLVVDGIVGPSTLEAINVPVERRISQIKLNMERWRWLPKKMEDRYILINTASFELHVVEQHRTVMKMKVIVGKPYWHTPIFSAKMSYIELNPNWNIPRSIFAEEILPKIKNDPDYLLKERIKVLESWSPDANEVDPYSIDWQNVTEENFKYRLRQEPGPTNPLGKIKFMFPNRFNVYLHDTPRKNLFERKERSFSHGCIRVEKPIELAEYVLRMNQGWDKKRLLSEINRGKTKQIELEQKIPVYILYFTTWVDESGDVYFYKDIYGRDSILENALKRVSPSA
ncbi:MAG: peptidoglycan-binding protein [Deltaproteobacteria bacterium]|nr:MAG: peptidoglycan-binding protein [Deltaproteobacteria bacterium]